MRHHGKRKFGQVGLFKVVVLLAICAMPLLPGVALAASVAGDQLTIQKCLAGFQELAQITGTCNPGAGATRLTVKSSNGLGNGDARFTMSAYGTGFTGANAALNNSAGLFAFGSLFFVGGTAGVPLKLFADNQYQGFGHLYISTSGNVGIGKDPTAKLDVNGTAKVKVIQITGGSDVSESFNVNSAADNALKPEPGMVVAIDPERSGELRIARTAYDRTVAGIISGAGGINPGMVMGQEGTVAVGGHPVALTGRVYCLTDATVAAVQPGDLLTTSDTPGHAMKVVEHDKAMGAIIGKAMTPLGQGEKGLVLVLVSLQ